MKKIIKKVSAWYIMLVFGLSPLLILFMYFTYSEKIVAPVLLITASNPPSIIMKIPTSIAFSNPCIGAIKTCDKVAPTVPLPLTISSPTNCAFGSTCDNIPRPKIRIRIIELQQV